MIKYNNYTYIQEISTYRIVQLHKIEKKEEDN